LIRVTKYKSYKGNVGKTAPILLNRDFAAEQPNQKWATDVTEFHLLQQKIYLSTILDLYNGEILCYTIYRQPVLQMVMDMLDKAKPLMESSENLILHSDQGWQYQHRAYREYLKKCGVSQSMSRKGNCLDNAVQENFFGLLKSEFWRLKKFETVDSFIEELEEYIDYYNNKRIKTKLKMSPVQYRLLTQKAA
jgi:transposase InsO family protein